VDEVVDEQTQFQIYYPPFEGAIEAGVGSVMCSYNKIRGTWSCENDETLQRDLKDRLGFKGWVMSDWGGTHSMSVAAGLDQEMPGSDYLSNEALISAVTAGSLPASRIDDGARRILTPFFAVGVFDRPNLNTQDTNVSNAEHSALARSLAANSIILLKNRDGALPLSASNGLKIVLFGRSALAPVVAGGGSGNVVPSFLPSPYDAIAAKLGVTAPVQRSGAHAGGITPNSSATAASAFASPSSELYPSFIPRVCDASGRACITYSEGANASFLAEQSASEEVAIVFVSSSSCEGSDRTSLAFDESGDDLVTTVAQAGFGRVVVAGVAPGAVLSPWRDAIDAFTLAFMPGQEYANALADVLFGQVSAAFQQPSFSGGWGMTASRGGLGHSFIARLWRAYVRARAWESGDSQGRASRRAGGRGVREEEKVGTRRTWGRESEGARLETQSHMDVVVWAGDGTATRVVRHHPSVLAPLASHPPSQVNEYLHPSNNARFSACPPSPYNSLPPHPTSR
jgi:beta-glucosidase